MNCEKPFQYTSKEPKINIYMNESNFYIIFINFNCSGAAIIFVKYIE